MKTILTLSLLFCFMHMGIAQGDITAKIQSTEDAVVIEKYNENGIKLFVVEVRNGVADGQYTEFYADGSIRETRTYSQGMLHGESYRYSPEGKLIAQASFENDQKSGTWIVWNQFTEQKVVFTYVDGIKTGASYFFDKDGLILDTVLY